MTVMDQHGRCGTIKGFVALSDRLGTAGQPTEAQFADVAAAGFEMVVNLGLPSSEGALPDEKAIVERHGLTYLHVPIDFQVPRVETAMRFFRALDENRSLAHVRPLRRQHARVGSGLCLPGGARRHVAGRGLGRSGAGLAAEPDLAEVHRRGHLRRHPDVEQAAPVTPLDGVPLAPLTTLGLGGRARYFVARRRRGDLVEALRWADARRLPVLVLGGGSNLVVADAASTAW